ncbi:MAG: DUF401 family protein [bacterium]
MILYIKLAVLVGVFLGALRLKVGLGTILLVCTGLVGLLFPVRPAEFLSAVFGAVLDRPTVELVAIVFITVMLGGLMRESGALREMTGSLREMIPDYRLVVAIPPALIGLLPMPAGALVSAPLVDEAAGGRPISAEARTFLNYWFRHLWEYVWPLYPGLLIGAAVLQVPVRRIAIAQYPLTIVALAIGLWFLYRRLPRDAGATYARHAGAGARRFARSVWPLGAIFAGVFLLRLSILAALAGTTLVLLITLAASRRHSVKALAKLAVDNISPDTVLLLLSVMMFKTALSVCGALEEIPRAFAASGIPPLVPLFVAPFLVGLLTGVNQAYVAITFPILAPLMHAGGAAGANGAAGAPALPAEMLDMSLVMFAYVSGFLGILLSPTHLCLVLTREYFRAEFRGVYRLLIPPVLCLLATALLLVALRGR